MKKTALLLLPVLLGACGSLNPQTHTERSSQVIPQDLISDTTSQLLETLKTTRGVKVLSGQHNREPNSDPTRWTRYVQSTTGKTPAVWGGDFLFSSSDIAARPTLIAEAKRQWQAGSLVTLTWNVCPPTVTEPCNWDSNGILADLTDAQWSQLITPGTGLYNAWLARLDRIVPSLQDLKNNNVPVLWRFGRDLNDGWSWWGGRPGANGSRKLYQITRDYLTGTKGLSNLIWVWNVKDVNMGTVSDYWPGEGYVDALGLNVWSKAAPSSTDYSTLVSLSGGRPIALTEVTQVPSPALLAAQPRWSWFMVWAESAQNSNTTAALNTTYSDAKVVSQDRTDLNINLNLALNRPVTASSQESTQNAPANVTDGDLNTRWSSSYADNQSLTIDLGQTRTINRVELKWEAAYASQYQVQVSLDKTTFTTVHSNYAADGGTDQIYLAPTQARYVRLYSIKRATSYGSSLWEMGVYGRIQPVAGSNAISRLAAATTVGTGGSWAKNSITVNNFNLPYQLYTPTTQPSSNQLPLIIHLHGSGEAGTDNVLQMMAGTHNGPQYFTDPNYQKVQAAYVLAPQTPVAIRWASTGIPEYNLDTTPETVSMTALQKLIENLVATLPNVDPDRVYFAGLSRGGQGVWWAAMTRANQWGAILPIAGSGSPNHASRLKDLAVWAFHATNDNTTSVQYTRNMVNGILAAGGNKVKFTEVPTGDHQAGWETAYGTMDAFNWLIRYRR
ncbi:glycosyl hydrolase [Deinococcus roseus]|uniref:F5/8 type C domain-containing protein n=1 Tax=Deinococcus roseus TaxID=392414 RepID=A0ABQ2D2D5_9DEIO|nr:glycosyl hydrolase [Deinococcus roseus]GGJ42276.1 hypothetical protein GCM10008938_30410 [Deinococcus roseus]